VLSDGSNVIVQLAPAPVVARVATATGETRAGRALDWLARDVDVVRFLAASGADVVPPASEVPPGPELWDGLAISFWRFVEHDREHPPSAAELGSALRRLHGHLGAYPVDLPPFTGLLDECGRVIERLERSHRSALQAALRRVRSALDGAGGPARPLQGDVGRGNLLRTPAGLVWTDFEDACFGPVEWDLGCLAASTEPDAAAALEAYGRPAGDEALAPFVEARRLQVAVWTAFLAETRPELRARAGARLSRVLTRPA
jgi:Phosphotransferase enzyme family